MPSIKAAAIVLLSVVLDLSGREVENEPLTSYNTTLAVVMNSILAVNAAEAKLFPWKTVSASRNVAGTVAVESKVIV